MALQEMNRETDGRLLRSSMEKLRGRSTRPWIVSRCFATSISGKWDAWYCTKCSGAGVMIPA